MATKTLKKAKKLTKSQMRVAVAKDALKQVQLENVVVLSGNGYVVNDELDNQICSINHDLEAQGKDTDKVELREHLDGILGKVSKCEVCAKGALFLSAIRKFNNFSLNRGSSKSIDGEASNETRKIFGKKNADLIEAYFEQSSPRKPFIVKDESDTSTEYYRWEDGYPNDKERLILILKNVIANKGTFKPKKLVWKSLKSMQESLATF